MIRAARIERHRAKLVTFAVRRFHLSRDAAEDVVQDAILYVWGRVQAGFDPDNVLEYLRWVVKSRALDYIKRNRRYIPEANDPEAFKSMLAMLPDGHDLATESAEEMDSRTDALAAVALLSTLPDTLRAVIMRVSVGGASYQQCADELGIPIGTVKTRIHRGRRLLNAMQPERANLN